MTIEQANEPSSPAERERWLKGWYRVAAEDGSTVAYCPDRATAVLIAEALEARKKAGERELRECLKRAMSEMREAAL